MDGRAGPPGLTLKATDSQVQPGGQLGFVVTDAGDFVAGAKVSAKLGGVKVSDTTDASGKAKLKIPGDAPKGKHVAEAEKDGYAREGYSGREEKFKVTG